MRWEGWNPSPTLSEAGVILYFINIVGERRAFGIAVFHALPEIPNGAAACVWTGGYSQAKMLHGNNQ